MNNLDQGLTFDDILLVPEKSLPSRSTADYKTKLSRNFELGAPLLGSNMDTVTETAMMNSLAKRGCLGALHRNMSIDKRVSCVEEHISFLKNELGLSGEELERYPVACAVGVNEDVEGEMSRLWLAGANVFVIDIAHGHSQSVIDLIKTMRERFFDKVDIIAGNVATQRGAEDLIRAGADALKVGIGPGCLAEGTPILMANGEYKPIESIRKGDRVIDGKGSPTEVEELIHSGLGQVDLVYHDNSWAPLSLTKSHMVLVSDYKDGSGSAKDDNYANGVWVPIEDIGTKNLLFPNKIDFELLKKSPFTPPFNDVVVGKILAHFICGFNRFLSSKETFVKEVSDHLGLKEIHVMQVFSTASKLSFLSVNEEPKFVNFLYNNKHFIKSLKETLDTLVENDNSGFVVLGLKNLNFVLSCILRSFGVKGPIVNSGQYPVYVSYNKSMEGEVPLYDLSVKSEDSSFIACNTIVHNSCCTTRLVTGFGVPQLTAIQSAHKARNCLDPNVAIIADGGVKHSGDIVKALRFGADTVMVGGMLSGTSATPYCHEHFKEKGEYPESIVFRGMSSYSARHQFQKEGYMDYAAEGVSTRVGFRGYTDEVLNEILTGVKSGMSYGGALDIKSLREVEYQVCTPNITHENRPRHFNS